MSSANFDRVAAVYRWAEYLCLGPLLRRTRETHLATAQHARRALLLGDGDGRFLAALLRRAPHLEATAVDTSPAMLLRLRARCRFASDRLSTRQADINALPTLGLDLHSYDLVTTHFLLDCLSQPEVARLATTLAYTLLPGALWLVSDFAIPGRQPWRLLGNAYVRSLYLAFRLLTGLRAHQLPQIAPALHAAGFRRETRIERLKGLLYSEVWRLEIPPQLP